MTHKQLTQVRGHPVYSSPEGWRYASDGVLVVDDHARPCVQCGLKPIPVEGMGFVDACFVYHPKLIQGSEGRTFPATSVTLPEDVTWACCGHGVEDGYIRWGNIPSHGTDAVIGEET